MPLAVRDARQGFSVRTPRILVLMAARNGAPWIREQLNSVLRQSGVDVHIAIADDASTDATIAEISGLESGGRIQVIRREQPTGSAGQNFLALIREQSADDFDYVALADQDDIWLEEKLARSSAALVESGCEGYSSAVVAFWPDGSTALLRQSRRAVSSDFLFEGAGQGCTLLLTGGLYGRVRQFMLTHRELTQTLVYHDWPLYALARVWGVRWYFDDKPTVNYRQHGGNDTGSRGSLQGVLRRVKLLRVGRYKLQISAVATLCVVASPSNPLASRWVALAARPDGLCRRALVVSFCLRHGRRKRVDHIAVIVAAVCGWI